jgi:hypothetical protein
MSPTSLDDDLGEGKLAHAHSWALNSSTLLWITDTKLPLFIDRPDRHASVLGNEADELLADVLDIVVLLQTADVCLDSHVGWLAQLRLFFLYLTCSAE